MLSRKDVFIIRDRKPEETKITVIHKQTGLRVMTSDLIGCGDLPEHVHVEGALEYLSEKVAEHYKTE